MSHNLQSYCSSFSAGYVMVLLTLSVLPGLLFILAAIVSADNVFADNVIAHHVCADTMFAGNDFPDVVFDDVVFADLVFHDLVFAGRSLFPLPLLTFLLKLDILHCLLLLS